MATTYADQASQQAASYAAYTPTPAPQQGSSSQLATPDPSQYTPAAPSQNVATTSSQPAVAAPPKQPAEVTRKDRTLAEFLLMLDDYEPLVRSSTSAYHVPTCLQSQQRLQTSLAIPFERLERQSTDKHVLDP